MKSWCFLSFSFVGILKFTNFAVVFSGCCGISIVKLNEIRTEVTIKNKIGQ